MAPYSQTRTPEHIYKNSKADDYSFIGGQDEWKLKGVGA